MKLVHRRLVSLGVMLGVAGLGAGLVVWQKRASEQNVKREERSHKLLVVEKAGDIRRLSLSTPDGTFELERPDGGDTWRITAPLATAADSTIVNGIVRHLVELARTRYLQGNDAPVDDLGRYGLDPPRFSVMLTDASGVNEKVYVGLKASFDGSLYVTTASGPRVAMVPGALEYQVDKSLFDLREKRLLVLEPKDVTVLSVHQLSGDGFQIERRGEDFAITAPRKVPADRAQVSGILSALAELRAVRFVSEAATRGELAAHGLIRPRVRVELTLGSDKPLEILFGETGAHEDTEYFAATRPGEPLVALSSDWVIKKLMTGVDELRDMRVLRFSRDDVRGISIKKGSALLLFEKTRQEERDDWRMIQPDPQDAIDSILSGLLYRLWSLKARRIVADDASAALLAEHGLVEPEVEVAVTGKDGAELGAILFGESSPGEQWVTAKGGGRIDAVDPSFADELSTAAGDYVESELEDG